MGADHRLSKNPRSLSVGLYRPGGGVDRGDLVDRVLFDRSTQADGLPERSEPLSKPTPTRRSLRSATTAATDSTSSPYRTTRSRPTNPPASSSLPDQQATDADPLSAVRHRCFLNVTIGSRHHATCLAERHSGHRRPLSRAAGSCPVGATSSSTAGSRFRPNPLAEILLMPGHACARFPR
jgi:hypothetical protein